MGGDVGAVEAEEVFVFGEGLGFGFGEGVLGLCGSREGVHEVHCM